MEEEKKPKNSDQEQVGNGIKGAGNAVRNTVNAGREAMESGRKAVQSVKKVGETAKKTVEMARKAAKMAVKAAKLAIKMIHALISAISALLNPVTWIVLGIILVIVIILAGYVYLINRGNFDEVETNWQTKFEGTQTKFGEDAKTVSGEFGKRFFVSQIDIGGPGEVSMNTSGCGPSSIAMALSELADQKIDAIEIAQLGLRNGCYSVGAGTSYDLYEIVVPEYSAKIPKLSTLKMTQSNSKEEAIKALQSGGQIVCNSRRIFPCWIRTRNLYLWV